MKKYEVTVLIATYNPVWEKLKNTVLSVTRQRGISVEIVVTDDGSKENYKKELTELFAEEKFEDYELVMTENNMGTVRNVENGLQKVHGKYVKCISPGDYLYDLDILGRWYHFMEENKLKFTFGDPIYYSEEAGKYTYHSVKRNPQNTGIYSVDKYNVKTAVLYYIFLNDAMLGSTFMTEKNMLIKYISEISGKIKYAEDMMVNLMIADGEQIAYFNEPVVWYESGTGISTGNSQYWYDILEKERYIAFQMICDKFRNEKAYYLHLCMKVIMKPSIKFAKYMLLPRLVFCKLKKDKIQGYTCDTPEVGLDKYLSELR